MDYLNKEDYDVSIRSDIFKYGIHNTTLLPTKQLAFSMKQPLELSDLRMDYQSLMSSQVSAEFTQSLEKELKSLMCQNEDYLDLVDLTNQPEDIKEKQTVDRLINFIYQSDYDFIIVNGKWASYLQDNVSFSYYLDSKPDKFSAQVYSIGKIYKIDVYVDPYMRYDADWAICGRRDSFQYNMKFDSIKDSYDSMSFSGLLKFSLRYDINMTDNFIKLHFMYKNTEAYSKFLSDRRDKKIDEIIK
jgi:hypothetical protein